MSGCCRVEAVKEFVVQLLIAWIKDWKDICKMQPVSYSIHLSVSSSAFSLLLSNIRGVSFGVITVQ